MLSSSSAVAETAAETGQTAADFRSWLQLLQPGSCTVNETDRLTFTSFGDCDTGSMGRWSLSGAIRTWPQMARQCIAMCGACTHCHYVSVHSANPCSERPKP